MATVRPWPFGQRRAPTDRFGRGVQVLFQRAVEGTHAGEKFFAGFGCVRQTKLVGIFADLGRQLVDLRFARQRHLGAAEAAIGTRRHGVGVERHVLDQHVGDRIGADATVGRFLDHQRAIFRVGAGVHQYFRLARDDLAVLIDRGAHPGVGIVAARGQHRFFDGELQFHRPLGFPRTGRHQRFDFGVRFTAVTAADKGNDQANFAHRQIEDRFQIMAHHERMLRRGVNRSRPGR